MSVLCLNVCRLCVQNIMSLGICFKKLYLVKVGVFAWYSVKFGTIFGVHLKDKHFILKKQTYMKSETCKLYSRVF